MTLHFPSYSFSPSLYLFAYSISWHFPVTPDVKHALFPSTNFRGYSISPSPCAGRTMPRQMGLKVGSLSLQQPQRLLFIHALEMLCQTLNAASLAAFVATACAQMWFSCKLIAPLCVKRGCPVHGRPVSVPPARYISIAWRGTRLCQSLLVAGIFCFIFFCFVFQGKGKKTWENSKRCLLFFENWWMLFTLTIEFLK